VFELTARSSRKCAQHELFPERRPDELREGLRANCNILRETGLQTGPVERVEDLLQVLPGLLINKSGNASNLSNVYYMIITLRRSTNSHLDRMLLGVEEESGEQLHALYPRLIHPRVQVVQQTGQDLALVPVDEDAAAEAGARRAAQHAVILRHLAREVLIVLDILFVLLLP